MAKVKMVGNMMLLKKPTPSNNNNAGHSTKWTPQSTHSAQPRRGQQSRWGHPPHQSRTGKTPQHGAPQ